EEDTQWWKDWFRSKGYLLSKDPDMNKYPYAFLLTNEHHDYFADVYPVKVNKDGSISITHIAEFHGRRWWEGKSWNDMKQVNYKGQLITVENYETVLQQKEGHIKVHGGTLGKKHLHDFQRAGRIPQI